MFFYDKELFFWVLQHELKHNKHYQDERQHGKPDIETEKEQRKPTGSNLRNKWKLFKFQILNPWTVLNFYANRVFGHRFALYDNLNILHNQDKIFYDYKKTSRKLTPLEEREIEFYMEGL